MPEPRPTPVALVFGPTAPERFAALRSGLEAAGRDPRDRDAFLLVREVAELLHELRPDAGVGAAVQALAAFLHYAYLFWMDGERMTVVNEAELGRMLDLPTSRLPDFPTSRPPDFPTSRPPDVLTRYIQLPALRVWATPVAGQPAEPLDGWFAARSGAELSLLAIFGLNQARGGLTAVELSGSRAAALVRPDGSPLFASLLEGGRVAGLSSLAGEAELLELAWRAEAAA
jgi:hypothetical protein